MDDVREAAGGLFQVRVRTIFRFSPANLVSPELKISRAGLAAKTPD
jgi:hypothetical protein